MFIHIIYINRRLKKFICFGINGRWSILKVLLGTVFVRMNQSFDYDKFGFKVLSTCLNTLITFIWWYRGISHLIPSEPISENEVSIKKKFLCYILFVETLSFLYFNYKELVLFNDRVYNRHFLLVKDPVPRRLYPFFCLTLQNE